METAYFVMHPTLGMTGVVYAPSTEKARTTFLDWLERNNHIKRADRQTFRRNMGAQRLDDPNVPSDVVLHYGYEDRSTIRYRLPVAEEEIILEESEPESSFEDYAAMEEMGHPLELPAPGPKLMPVQQVMLRGFTQ